MGDKTRLTTINDDGTESEPIEIINFYWQRVEKASQKLKEASDRICLTLDEIAEWSRKIADECWDIEKSKQSKKRQLPYHQRINLRSYKK